MFRKQESCKPCRCFVGTPTVVSGHTAINYLDDYGQIVATLEVVDYTQRREYIAVAANLGGYDV